MLAGLLEVLGIRAPDLHERVSIVGADPILPTRFRVGEAAAAALAGCGVAADALWQARGGRPQDVRVRSDVAAASLLGFVHQQRLDAGGGSPGADQGLVRIQNATTAMYPAGDGAWIHLHGGFPHLHAGTLELLGLPARDDDRESIARAVSGWEAQALEDALAERRLCGARVRTAEEWRAHPQGRALEAVPLIELRRIGDAPPETLGGGADARRPLDGARVLDFTRVLAGPTVGRTLASHGAEVLRVHAPHLPFIAPFATDTGHGKRSTMLDLRDEGQRRTALDLARSADVVTLGYRRGALDRFGFGAEQLAAERPGIVVVSVNCYGHDGPWAGRGGWEQLAQAASGIAHEQGLFVSGEGAKLPALLPAAVTDYTTGYLGALGALRALQLRGDEGGSWEVCVSLTRTAMWLQSLPRADGTPVGFDADALAQAMRRTQREGFALAHLGPVLEMSETPPRWDHAAGALGGDAPAWATATAA